MIVCGDRWDYFADDKDNSENMHHFTSYPKCKIHQGLQIVDWHNEKPTFHEQCVAMHKSMLAIYSKFNSMKPWR